MQVSAGEVKPKFSYVSIPILYVDFFYLFQRNVYRMHTFKSNRLYEVS